MATAPHETIESDSDVRLDAAWNVIVWDDPVNLMAYVVFVFRKLFGFTEAEATKRMLEVHHNGKSVVASVPRERAEMDCYRLHRYGLWATIERSS